MTAGSTDSAQIKQHMRGIFDRAAPTYDQVGARFFQEFGRRLVEVAGLASGSTVLDVAAGRGAVLFPAAEAVGRAGRVLGIDLAPGMIATTEADVAAHGITNVELRQIDAEGLELADRSFDAVLCGFALFLLPRIDQALAEMRRVLCPGGRIAVSTWTDVFGPEFDWLMPLQSEFLPVQQVPARNSDGSTPEFHTPQGLTAALRGAGFAGVTIVADSARFTYADEDAWWQSLWSHGMRGWLEAVEQQLGVSALQHFKAAAFAQLRSRQALDGIAQTSSVLYGIASRPSS